MTTAQKQTTRKTPQKKLILPDTVRVGPTDVSIVTEPLEARQKYHQFEDTSSLGFYDSGSFTIVLSPDLPNDKAIADVSVHEAMHSIYWQHGGRIIFGGGHKEEKLISFLSGPLTRFIQDNPEFINYVVEAGKR